MALAHHSWPRTAPLLAWSICAVTLALVALTAALAILNIESIASPDEANAIDIVLPIGFAVLGALVAASLPRNAVGWLFLGLASLQVISGATTQYSLITPDPGVPKWGPRASAARWRCTPRARLTSRG